MFFKFQCYIIDIKNNELIVNIHNKDDLLRFQNNLIKLYKTSEGFNYEQSIFKIKINKYTKFEINFDYSNMQDLKGVNVYISGSSKYYCFSFNDEILNEMTNTFITIKKIKKGHTFYANKISN